VKFSIDDLAARTEPEPWDGTFSLLIPSTTLSPDPKGEKVKPSIQDRVHPTVIEEGNGKDIVLT